MKKQTISSYNTIIVEDEPYILNSLERHLKQIDPAFQVVGKFQNGKDALDFLKQEVIHLVITDISMPVMDGITLSQKIHEAHPHVITIIMTGFADFNYARAALKYHVFEYLLKPVNPEELSDCLNKIRLQLDTNYTLTEESHPYGKDTAQTVNYLKLYIKENYMHEVDFSVLAANLGFSSAYLTKIFTKHVGESPIKYLTGVRINEAKRLLADTTIPIHGVGESVGYPDQFYFSKTFRKWTGINPSAYRKKSE